MKFTATVVVNTENAVDPQALAEYLGMACTLDVDNETYGTPPCEGLGIEIDWSTLKET